MADRVINYRKNSDNLITVTIDGIDLADGGGTKTVTANIYTARNPTVVALISSGITVTATGDPSTITIQPTSTMKDLAAGVYSMDFQATDSGGLNELTSPPIQLNVVTIN